MNENVEMFLWALILIVANVIGAAVGYWRGYKSTYKREMEKHDAEDARMREVFRRIYNRPEE